RADEFAHQPHALAGAASDVQAGPARPQSNRLEDSACRRLKHLGLMPKPFIFVARMPEYMVVAHRRDHVIARLELQGLSYKIRAGAHAIARSWRDGTD